MESMQMGNSMEKIGVTHRNLDQEVYQKLKEMILARQLVPGEKIPQEKLARELGISRTPLISALKQLEQEKLVIAKPRRGFFVRLFTREEMIAIFELREVLEGLAARRAAQCISDAQSRKLSRFFSQFNTDQPFDTRAYAMEDRRFHNFVVDVGGEEFLRSILHSYNIIAFSYQINTEGGLLRPPEETIAEHRAIIDAIVARHPAQAEDLMRHHLKKSTDRLRADLAVGAVDSTISTGYVMSALDR